MSASRPPSILAAGDSIAFALSFSSDYAGWTGTARLGSTDGTVTVDGTTASVSFGTGDTEDLAPGRYTLAVALSNGDERRTIASYSVQITPNLIDAADGEDTRSHAERMLAIVEAALEARLSGNSDGGIESYQIDNTTVSKIPTERLQQLRRQYAAEVAAAGRNGAIPSVQFMVPNDLRCWWNVR